MLSNVQNDGSLAAREESAEVNDKRVTHRGRTYSTTVSTLYGASLVVLVALLALALPMNDPSMQMDYPRP